MVSDYEFKYQSVNDLYHTTITVLLTDTAYFKKPVIRDYFTQSTRVHVYK